MNAATRLIDLRRQADTLSGDAAALLGAVTAAEKAVLDETLSGTFSLANASREAESLRSCCGFWAFVALVGWILFGCAAVKLYFGGCH